MKGKSAAFKKNFLVFGIVFIFLAFLLGFWKKGGVVFSFSNRIRASGSIFLSKPSLYFSKDKAFVSFSVVNQSLRETGVEGKVVVREEFGRILWRKSFDLEGLAKGEGRELEFSWEPRINLLGKVKVDIQAWNEEGEKIENEIGFLVVPGPVSGVAAASILLLSTRGLGRILGMV